MTGIWGYPLYVYMLCTMEGQCNPTAFRTFDDCYKIAQESNLDQPERFHLKCYYIVIEGTVAK